VDQTGVGERGCNCPGAEHIDPMEWFRGTPVPHLCTSVDNGVHSRR
jgi:hypothetical protein